MPAIDPTRLKRELAGLTAALDDPQAASRAILSFLSDHNDHVRRPSAAGSGQLGRSFGVPRPVVRELTRALISAVAGRPAQAAALSDMLWRSDYREARIVAASLAGTRSDPGVSDWVENHAPEALDSTVRHALAKESLRSWRRLQPAAYLDKLGTWLGADRGVLTDLALSCLADVASDPANDYDPRWLKMLEPCLLNHAPRHRRALLEAVGSLAKGAASETALWLADAYRRAADKREAGNLILKSLDAFPGRQQQLLRDALSA